MKEHPLIGRTLHSNYRIERLLGCGGMACVYYAWDENLDRAAAVKVIDTAQQMNPAYARRIVQEAKSIAKWRHENIVQVYHAASEEGMYYFAMEYIEGRDLGGLLNFYVDRNELMPHQGVLQIGWAVAHALDYAHAHGVIHRDVKPANVMIANDGRIILTDFGLALDVAQGTDGEVFGSPHYIAPEQAVTSTSAVPESDLYSLGIILFEMLIGSVPFDDPSPLSLAVKHISAPLPLPSSLNPEISTATEAVLIKALSKEPQERYQSGEALMKALEYSLLDTNPPVSLTETPHRGISRTSLAQYVAQQSAAAPSRRQRRTKAAKPAAEPTIESPKESPKAVVKEAKSPKKTASKPDKAAESRPAPPKKSEPVESKQSKLVAKTPKAAPPPPKSEPKAAKPAAKASKPEPKAGGSSSKGVSKTKVERAKSASRPSKSTAKSAAARSAEPARHHPLRRIAVFVIAALVLSVIIAAAWYFQRDRLFPSEANPPTVIRSTSTVAPSRPAPTRMEAPTVPYSLMLYYDENGFFVWNSGDRDVPITSLAFQAINDDGTPAPYEFSGELWAELYETVQAGHCDAVLLEDAPTDNRPKDCTMYNASRTRHSSSPLVFWLPREGVDRFRVTWSGEEIAICEITAGMCEIELSLPAGE